MTYVIRLWRDCYEELIRYYPRYYRDVREMVAILHAFGSLCDTLYDNIDRVYNNNFIDYMDEGMISALEKWLGLSAGSRTLEERRAILKAYFVGFGKISATAIRRIIAVYGDVETDIVFEPIDDSEYPDNALYITIYEDEDQAIDTRSAFDTIKMRLPAHIWYFFFLVVQVLVDSFVERAYLTSMTLTFRHLYMYRMLDGTWILDGTWRLGAHMVPMHTALWLRWRSELAESATTLVQTPCYYSIDSMTERAYAANMTILTQPFSEREEARAPALGCRFAGGPEESTVAMVTITRDLWYLDGGYTLDGTRILDAEIIAEMEVI